MEIRTCEEYVLARLKEAEERAEDLSIELLDAKMEKLELQRKIEELTHRIETLRKQLGEKDEPV